LLLLAAVAMGDGRIAVTASSVHSDEYQPHYAFDGNAETRWASRGGDQPQWLQIDLGRAVGIEGLTIQWEHAYAADYDVQVSGDGKEWRTLHHQPSGKGGRETVGGLSGEGRFVRVYCRKPGPHGLSSIWEITFAGTTGEAIAQIRRRAAEERRAAETAAKAGIIDELAANGAEEIVFAARRMGDDGHWYANFGYYAREPERKAYGAPGGKLCRLNLKTGKLTNLIDDPAGQVRDPQVHYDGRRIIFSYRKGGSEHYNLYEINADGTGLRQITDGAWDDIEPAYLPDGGIVFISSRCKRWVNCWLTQVAVLHRCDADGSNVRMLSGNIEHDNTPWVLPDGRIIYQRWEYVDRSQVDYHHLWTMNPDGTNQMVYFGNQRPGTLMIDAKPIPNSGRILATFSPGHGMREHEGPFYAVDPDGGPDDQSRAKRVGKRSGRDPFPVSDKWILYANGRSIRVSDHSGSRDVVLYTDPKLDLHEPRPLSPRQRETVIPPRVDPSKETGRLILTNVNVGRNMEGVKPGEIRKLLVLESLPKPINYTGGMDPLTYGGSFTLERVVGTVPVEADGSAYFELPALRSFFFVAMDANDLSVKRMQSFLSVQPGETLSCIGCHEDRAHAVHYPANLKALMRAPSKVRPVRHVPEVFDFPRDVQPILDKHCVSCHDYEKHEGASDGPRAGGVALTGDRGPMFSHSYYTLTITKQFADGRNEAVSNRAPRSIGSSASPIMKKLSGEHYGAKLTPQEIDVIRYWIEVGAPYPGTYAALGTGMIGGYYENNQVVTDDRWPQSIAASEAITRRCASCHQNVPRNLSDEATLSFWRPDWNDPRLKRNRHILFNLSRPRLSLALLAPLAKEAGGYGRCVAKDGQPVFTSAADPDYQKILGMAKAGREKLEQIKRFDMPGFRADPAYVREMKRYGVLAADHPADALLDVYALDRAYWKSLWYVPVPKEQ
jgi:hypothetical protein